MRILFVLGLLASLPAQAQESCTPVDLRAEIGAPLHQGDSGYCFAHSSAILAQHKLGFRISPIQLAMGYLLTNFDEFLGSADPEVKAKLTPEFFASWEKDRLYEPHNYDPDKILGENGLFNTGGEEVATLLAANFLGLCPMSRLPTGKTLYKKYLKEVLAYHEARVRDGISETGPIGGVSHPQARAMAWSFRHWVEEKCGTPVRATQALVPATVAYARNLHELRALQALNGALALEQFRNNVIAAIDRQLDLGKPVAVGYAFSDLQDDSTAGLRAGEPELSKVDHSALFAGRRKVKGQCYYFLRNSFGNDLSDYKKNLRGRTEEGGVWIRPEEIPSLYSAVWLE